jgi:acyl-CoA synthetase (AMP-forming)/AMP-acid ligase II
VATLLPEAIDAAPAIGRPLPGVAMEIVDESGRRVAPGRVGELRVAGPGLMRGYRGDPRATAAALRDGWLYTADLAREEGGLLHLVGRRDRAFVAGGVLLLPEEIEAVLLDHPAIAAARVSGEPSAEGGAQPVAQLVLRPRATLPIEELHRFLDERLARAKWPRRVDVRPALPATRTGKIAEEE